MRSHTRLAAIAVTAAFVVPFAVFGAPALAGSTQSSSAQYQYGTTRVTVCHRTHSATHPYVKITVSLAGWLNGHSRHAGDVKLTDPTASCPTTLPTSASPSSAPGNSGNHGNSGDNGHHGKP
jgi:hypothetical protein